MTHAATMAEIRHAWYGVHVPWWSTALIVVALVLVLLALAVDPQRNRLQFCSVHLERGVHVTLVDGACVLCQFPPEDRSF